MSCASETLFADNSALDRSVKTVLTYATRVTTPVACRDGQEQKPVPQRFRLETDTMSPRLQAVLPLTFFGL